MKADVEEEEPKVGQEEEEHHPLHDHLKFR
jgi:hypothetical protein